jgi:hypothetical protein
VFPDSVIARLEVQLQQLLMAELFAARMFGRPRAWGFGIAPDCIETERCCHEMMQ